MVIRSSARFPLFSALVGEPFTWSAGVDGPPADEGGGLGDEDAVAVAMASCLTGGMNKEN